MFVTRSRKSFDLRSRSVLLALPISILLAFVAGAAHATSVPQNLGNGLDKLIQTKVPAFYNSAAQEQGDAIAALAITDEQGRVMVRINPIGKSAGKPTTTINALRSTLALNIASLSVAAVDESYRDIGVMDAFVALEDVPKLATSAGVRSVILELKPYHHRAAVGKIGTRAAPASDTFAAPGDTLRKLGTAFDFGVTQHRVDQINTFYNSHALFDYEGQGMSIGFISDSFGNTSSPTTPAMDVASLDLPGDAGNPVNTTAVVVLQDLAVGGTDEGRGMVQIGYKMAPKAKLAFATADLGEVGFANNIRALAGIPANLYPGQTFAADTICDDVGYFDEPFFQDGIISQGVNDAANFGVSYFSSAANDIGINGYESDIRWVANGTGLTAAAGNTALAGTNINLTNVPTALYAGGFHNFNPVPGQLDVAQLVNIASNNTVPVTLQWDDPYDQSTAPDYILPAVFTGSGSITAAVQTVTFNVPTALTAGRLYEVDAGDSDNSGIDVVVTVKDSGGNVVIGPQDNSVDEKVHFFAPSSGNYSIIITPCCGTIGDFNVSLFDTNGYTNATLSTDINLLVFDANTGAYLPGSSLTTNNFATNEPFELGFTNHPASQTRVQYVISRSNVPASGGPTHVRYLLPGNGRGGYGPAEYFSYNTVTTGGHAMAAGGNGTAAYSVFRPNLPESFTSPGPVRIYFDSHGARLDSPEVRLQPHIAAADNGNTSFFEGAAADSVNDLDANPNFSGTSAAGPHAAALAALVLQAHGGHHSVTPTQMTSLLERSTFPHDLDPSYASGVAHTSTGGTVRITVNSDASSNFNTGFNDKNSFAVSYSGASSLTSLVFNPAGQATTGGNVTGGNNGVGDVTPATTPPTVSYFENNFPGMIFVSGSFVVGSASTVPAANVTAAFSNQAPLPSGTGVDWTLSLTFPGGAFTSGNVLRYGVNRGQQHSANVSATGGTGSLGGQSTTAYLGDLFGGGVSLPSGVVNTNGMTFTGTTADGGSFTGTIKNRIGQGYSPVDGYGLINAQIAVGQTVQ